MVRINIDGEALDMPQGFSFDIEDTSPIFNDRGSQSVPATVPPTPRNLRLTGFKHRLDADMESADKSCEVVAGSYVRRGSLNISSVSAASGITFNIGFDNSVAYEKWQKKQLPDLVNLPVLDYAADDDPGADVLDYIWGAVYSQARPDEIPFAVFPIAVGMQTVDSTGKGSVSTNYWEILNAPGRMGGEITGPVKRVIDGKVTEVDVPPRYGVTPFLRVWYVLELLFEEIGFRMISNPFKEGDLARLVVLNNTADALCTGKIHISDLMPDCTVESFLNALWVRFGCVYNLNFNNRTADVKLLKDILKQGAVEELSANAMALPVINFSTRQYLTLSAAASLENAAPACERFEDFIKGCDTDQIYVTSSPSGNYGHECVYDPVCCMWYKTGDSVGTFQEKSTAFFNWDPQPEGMEAVELSSDDEWVPLRNVAGESDGVAGAVPFFATGSKHRHTLIRGNDKKDDDSNSAPLAFMWAFTGTKTLPLGTIGRLSHETGEGETFEWENPEISHSTTLLFQFKNGLYDRFWKEYDALLRNAPRTCEVRLRIPMHRLSMIDFISPVVFNGALCLIDKLKYSLPAQESAIMAEAAFRLISSKASEKDMSPVLELCALRHGWKFISSDMNKMYQSDRARKKAVSLYLPPNSWHTDPQYETSTKKAVLAAYPLKVWAVGMTWDRDPRFQIPPQVTSRGETITATYQCRAKYSMMLEIYPKKNGQVSNFRPVDRKKIDEFDIPLEYTVKLEKVGS